VVFTYGSLEETRGVASLGNQAGITSDSALRGTLRDLPKLLGSVGCKFYSCSVPTKNVKQPLSVTHPDLAKEADGWDPSGVTSGSSKKLPWICSKNHHWRATVTNRTSRESGCPYCIGKSVLPGFNDLITTYPIVACEADGWNPEEFSAGSSKRMSWKCRLGHKWAAAINDRTNGNQCPYCTNRKVFSGFNDLNTLHPNLAQEAHGWDPTKVLAGTHKRLEWKCKFGHVWKSMLYSRISSEAGCPVCSGHKLLSGYNDLKTTHPLMALEADGWDPSTVQKGSRGLKSWKCKEGHRWMTSPNSRTNSSTGCPTCAFSGFDPNLDSFLYFLQHSTWEMFQIGITNSPDDRLSKHKRLGWELLELRGPMDGHLTQQWETAILRMLKAKGADLSNSKIAGKFDGYSEAWSKSTFEAKSIKQLMQLTEEIEENSLKNGSMNRRIKQ